MKKKLFTRKKTRQKNAFIYLPIVTLLLVGTLYYLSLSYSPKWNFKWEGIRKEVKDSIIALDVYGEIAFDNRTQSGRKIQQFYRQKWILKNANNKELLKLLEYPSGTVKAMAYQGLVHSPKVKKYPLFKKSLNDTLTFVFYQSGCTGSGVMLSEYVINFISRLSNEVPPILNPPKIDITSEEKKEILALLEEKKSKETYYQQEFYKTIK